MQIGFEHSACSTRPCICHRAHLQRHCIGHFQHTLSHMRPSVLMKLADVTGTPGQPQLPPESASPKGEAADSMSKVQHCFIMPG